MNTSGKGKEFNEAWHDLMNEIYKSLRMPQIAKWMSGKLKQL